MADQRMISARMTPDVRNGLTGRGRWVGVTVVLAAVITVLGAWFFWDSGQSVTFDAGETTYSGPTEFAPGMVEFDWDFDPADVRFALWGVTDEAMTRADMESRATEIEYPNIPEWVNPRAIKYVSEPGEFELFLTEGTWGLWAVVDPDGANTAELVARFEVR